jgi:hypothetical protein
VRQIATESQAIPVLEATRFKGMSYVQP